jgi:hypothetical protein
MNLTVAGAAFNIAGLVVMAAGAAYAGRSFIFAEPPKGAPPGAGEGLFLNLDQSRKQGRVGFLAIAVGSVLQIVGVVLPLLS